MSTLPLDRSKVMEQAERPDLLLTVPREAWLYSETKGSNSIPDQMTPKALTSHLVVGSMARSQPREFAPATLPEIPGSSSSRRGRDPGRKHSAQPPAARTWGELVRRLWSTDNPPNHPILASVGTGLGTRRGMATSASEGVTIPPITTASRDSWPTAWVTSPLVMATRSSSAARFRTSRTSGLGTPCRQLVTTMRTLLPSPDSRSATCRARIPSPTTTARAIEDRLRPNVAKSSADRSRWTPRLRHPRMVTGAESEPVATITESKCEVPSECKTVPPCTDLASALRRATPKGS